MALRRTLIGLAALCLAIAGFSACGGEDDSISQEDLEQAKEEGAQEARTEAELQELQRQIEALKRKRQQEDDGSAPPATTGAAPATGGVPADATDCGAGIYARAGSTSCGFAYNVAEAYLSSGAGTVQAFSPATGQTYSMTCTSGVVITCTGGNNAAVYIASS